MNTHQLSFEALGTRWWIETSRPLSSRHRQTIKKLVADFEAAYSRFRDDSIIGRLNHDKTIANSSAEFRSMLEYARSMYHKTEGIFNVTVGAQLEAQGYGLQRPQHAQAQHLSNNIDADITWNTHRVTIAPSVILDFGGFGKGWLIDSIARALQQLGYDDGLVNGGGDILAFGQPKTIVIEHPHQATLAVGEVTLHNEALCSSSVHKRTWTAQDGTQATHIQPTTNHAKDELASVHVRAKTALYADTLATVFLLVQHKKRLQFADQFGVQFLEILPNLTYWQQPGFGFSAYS